MKQLHVVSHADRLKRPGRHDCWSCANPGTHLKNGRYYCAEHFRHAVNQGWQAVTPEHVRVARQMMINGGGLTDIAISLDVSRQDLDIALFRHIAEPLGRAPRAMFE